MADMSLDILIELEAEGWRLWGLHQHTRGYWECRLYNNRTPARGEGSGFLSPDGMGDTPRAAILAALGRVDDAGPLAKVPSRELVRLERNLACFIAALEGVPRP